MREAREEREGVELKHSVGDTEGVRRGVRDEVPAPLSLREAEGLRDMEGEGESEEDPRPERVPEGDWVVEELRHRVGDPDRVRVPETEEVGGEEGVVEAEVLWERDGVWDPEEVRHRVGEREGDMELEGVPEALGVPLAQGVEEGEAKAEAVPPVRVDDSVPLAQPLSVTEGVEDLEGSGERVWEGHPEEEGLGLGLFDGERVELLHGLVLGVRVGLLLREGDTVVVGLAVPLPWEEEGEGVVEEDRHSVVVWVGEREWEVVAVPPPPPLPSDPVRVGEFVGDTSGEEDELLEKELVAEVLGQGEAEGVKEEALEGRGERDWEGQPDDVALPSPPPAAAAPWERVGDLLEPLGQALELGVRERAVLRVPLGLVVSVPVGDTEGVWAGEVEALKHREGVKDREGVELPDRDASRVALLVSEPPMGDREGEGDTDPVPVPPTQVALGQPLLVIDTVEVLEGRGDRDKEGLPLGEREAAGLLVQEVVTHRDMEVVGDMVGVTGGLKDTRGEAVRGEGELLGLPDRVTEAQLVADWEEIIVPVLDPPLIEMEGMLVGVTDTEKVEDPLSSEPLGWGEALKHPDTE